jgi:hypothetical protein
MTSIGCIDVDITINLISRSQRGQLYICLIPFLYDVIALNIIISKYYVVTGPSYS